MVDGLVGHVRTVGISTVVAPALPHHPVLVGKVLVHRLHARALDTTQHLDLAVREHLTETPRIHPACQGEPLAAGVCPRRHLFARQPRIVRTKRHARIKAYTVLAYGDQPRAVPCQEPHGIVADRRPWPEEDHRHDLERDRIVSCVEIANPGGHETHRAVLDIEPAAAQPGEAVSLDVGDAGGFETEAAF